MDQTFQGVSKGKVLGPLTGQMVFFAANIILIFVGAYHAGLI